jgi:hypothetical protein
MLHHGVKRMLNISFNRMRQQRPSIRRAPVILVVERLKMDTIIPADAGDATTILEVQRRTFAEAG